MISKVKFLKTAPPGGGAVHSLQNGFLCELSIPLLPLDIQHRIVAELEAEWALVEANWKLVEIFEQKIQTRLNEIWHGGIDDCGL